MTTSTQSIEHLSTKPWSDYTAADYTLKQWHDACLIHHHNGPPTMKTQCKLPIKTPNGAVNKNGVFAAAAALAGARSTLIASPDEKSKAAKTLVGFYKQMNKPPPPSLLGHSMIQNELDLVKEFIEHHGVKGQKWGIRIKRKQPSISKGKSKAPSAHSLSDEELRKAVSRMQLEQQYSSLMSKKATTNRGAKFANSLLKHGTGIAGNIAKNSVTNLGTKYATQALEDAIKSGGRKKKKKK